jgi:hypothetical protein
MPVAKALKVRKGELIGGKKDPELEAIKKQFEKKYRIALNKKIKKMGISITDLTGNVDVNNACTDCITNCATCVTGCNGSCILSTGTSKAIIKAAKKKK